MDPKQDLPAEESKVYMYVWEAGGYSKWVFIGGRKKNAFIFKAYVQFIFLPMISLLLLTS